MKSQYTILADCELSTRTVNALAKAGYKTIGEIIAAADHELLRLPNFGRQSLREIRNVQNEYLSTEGLDVLTILRTYQKRARTGGAYVLNEHLEMIVLEIEHLRGHRHEQS